MVTLHRLVQEERGLRAEAAPGVIPAPRQSSLALLNHPRSSSAIKPM